MSSTIGLIISATLILIVIYLFLFNAESSSKVIGSLSSGYVDIVTALQGRGGRRDYLS